MAKTRKAKKKVLVVKTGGMISIGRQGVEEDNIKIYLK
jgi:hypothetical protein